MKAVLQRLEPARLLLAAAFRRKVDDLHPRVIFKARRNFDSRCALYAFSVVATIAALYVRLAFSDTTSGHRPGLLILLVPVVLSAWLGGFGPGLVATVLATLEADYFLLAPVHTFAISDYANRRALISFGITGMLVSIVSEILHRARRRAEDSELRQRFLGKASAVLARSLDYRKDTQDRYGAGGRMGWQRCVFSTCSMRMGSSRLSSALMPTRNQRNASPGVERFLSSERPA